MLAGHTVKQTRPGWSPPHVGHTHRWVNMTPLGCAVVPEVYTIFATSSGSTTTANTHAVPPRCRTRPTRRIGYRMTCAYLSAASLPPPPGHLRRCGRPQEAFHRHCGSASVVTTPTAAAAASLRARTSGATRAERRARTAVRPRTTITRPCSPSSSMCGVKRSSRSASATTAQQPLSVTP